MSAPDRFDVLFAPEPAPPPATPEAGRWKLLLVDDEEGIHTMLHLALRDVVVEGRGLTLLDARSAADARTLLAAHPDIALLLLDVVMETPDAGLQLVRHVRHDLHNRSVQIILLTGQPGHAPAREVVSQFAIDGYRLKSELSADKLFVTVYAALRAYQALRDLLAQRHELEALAQALREREDRLRAVVETAPDAILLVDQRGAVFGWNEGATHLFGYTRAEMLGQSVARLMPPALQSVIGPRIEALRSAETARPLMGQAFEITALCKNGQERPIEYVLGSWQAGGEHCYSAIVRDLSARRRAEADLRLAASVYASSYEGIIIADAHKRIIDVNPAFTRITGYSRAEVLGQTPGVLASGRHDEGFYRTMNRSLEDFDFWQGEVWNRRRSGEVYAEILSISVVRDPAGRIQHYIGVFTDISSIKAHQEELYRSAHFDVLTGVPNRRLLSDRLAQAIARAQRSGKVMAVCYMDLDGFKQVNDSLGHAAGDHVLVEIANRLKHTLRGDDTLARLGGDEFVVLLTDLGADEGCDLALQRIVHEVARPIELPEGVARVSASLGVTLYPEDCVDADTLLRHADQAMYLAKAGGHSQVRFFDAERDREVRTQRDRLQRLRAALRNGELTLHYQPRVDLVDGRILGAEALIRWQHPEQGCLEPARFLPDMAGSSLGIEVGDWVIETALQQLQDWAQQGLSLHLSVNISADHLLQAEFCERLCTQLARHPDVKPEQFELEMLESAALTDLEGAVRTLIDCRRLGVQVALDDFGTGYSSLTYFLNLPVNLLKIDQSFVRVMLDDPQALGIIESVLHLGRAFNRSVVAEGVESLQQAALLASVGCHQAQGYVIARPMPASQLPDWCETWRRGHAWPGRQQPRPEEDLTLTVAARALRRWSDQVLQQVRGQGQGADLARSAFAAWYAGNGAARYGGLRAFEAIACPLQALLDGAAALGRQTTASEEPVSGLGEADVGQHRDQILRLLGELQATLAGAPTAAGRSG